MSAITLTIRQLLATPAIVAEVGQNVFPVKIPQGTSPPYIVVALVGEDETLRHLGGAGGEFGARVSVACMAGDATSADYIAENVKLAIGDLLNVEVFDPGTSPPERLGIIVQTDKAGAEVFDWSEDGSVFRRMSDFNVRWRP